MLPVLMPLPYHVNLRAYLQQHEAELWAWFSSVEAASDYAANVRLDLLKSTYRLERDAHVDLYTLLDAAGAAIGVDEHVTLYQWQQHDNGINATVFYTPAECHIAFVGNILTLLSKAELSAVFGHELAHVKLWKEDASSYFVVDSIVSAMAGDTRAAPSHLETARLLRLYTEIYCDRGALLATGDLAAVQSSLIKTHTGLATVSADSYRRQVDEIMLEPGATSEQIGHPELHIRTRALDLFAGAAAGGASESQLESDSEKQIEAMIEGDAGLERLDLLAQARMTELTKRFVAAVVARPWMRTDIVIGHAKLFDVETSAPATVDGSLFADQLAKAHAGVRDYFSYILLDFATVDSSIEEAAMASSIQFAEAAGLAEPFERILAKDLKLTKRDIARLMKRASAVVEKSEASL
jgi:hypothetical protein